MPHSQPPEGIPERRHLRGRRKEDDEVISEDVERGIRVWLKLMFIHRVKLLALGAALGSPLAYLGGCVSGLRESLTLKAQVATVEARVTTLEEAAGIQTFLLCLSTPTTAPPAVAKMCNDIVRQGIAPRRAP